MNTGSPKRKSPSDIADDLISAGFMISHLSHTLGEIDAWMMRRWEIDEVRFVRTCLMMGYKEEAFNQMVKVNSLHPIAFQYGRRFYFN